TKTFFSVGSGTGPTTVAPARVTVSTILRAELSMTSWSYDLSRMRIFCPAMSDSLPLVHRGLALTRRPRATIGCCVSSAFLLTHHCLSVKQRSVTHTGPCVRTDLL